MTGQREFEVRDFGGRMCTDRLTVKYADEAVAAYRAYAAEMMQTGKWKHVLYVVEFGKPGAPSHWELGIRCFKDDEEFFRVTGEAYKSGAYYIGALHGAEPRPAEPPLDLPPYFQTR